jgi:hypothetical protein
MPLMSDPQAAGPDPARPDSGHGHEDHGHASETLGPIDLAMWGVGLLGAAIGLLVAVCCAFAEGVL